MKKSSPLSKALKIYGDKGPVNRATSQRAARHAYIVFERLLTDAERTKLSIARGHASMNEGRGEFDAVMKDIKERLLGHA